MMPQVSQEAVGTPSIRTRERWGWTVEILRTRGRRICVTGKDLGTGKR